LTLIATTIDSLILAQRSFATPTSPTAMFHAEEQHRAFASLIADHFIASNIVSAHLDARFREEAAAEARQRFVDQGVIRNIENRGWSPVTILLPGGLRLKLLTPYLLPSRKGLRGRKRGSGKRGEGGVGSYPVLERLGIAWGASPMTRSIVSRQVVLCSSYAEANEQLAHDGLCLDKDQMVRLASHCGGKALELRDEALAAALDAPLPEASMVAGQRIRVSVDGGRARIRRTNRRARKGKNGRRPFLLDWREPRIITIDVLDDKGESDRHWRPIYEVSLGDADRVFELLCGLLRLIGAHLAAQVVFVSDGAEWIWNRVEALFARAEVPRERVELVLDYYHATEHIADALKACKNLSLEQRAAFVRIFSKELLEAGGPERVIAKLRGFAHGRRSKAMNKEIAYLVGHQEAGRMRYAALRAAKVPIGSGVVESTVRRVINLRFKSASQCWCEERLEELMYLRAILKSGRWDDAMEAQLEGRHFLSPLQRVSSSEAPPMDKAA
jgi:hypothetical protein